MARRNGRNPKSPAYQQYPADFLSDTRVAVMDAEEVGAFFLLLQYQWLGGSLEDDLQNLAALARVPLERFEAKVWPKVRKCFEKLADGRWANPRLERERQAQADGRARLKAASEAANEARWGSRSDPDRIPSGSQSDPDGVRNHPSPKPYPLSPIPYSLSPRERARASEEPIPEKPVPERRVPVPRTDGHVDVLPGAESEARAHWGKEFQRVTGRAYAFRRSKDQSVLREILTALESDTEEFKRRATALLEDPPMWIAERGGDVDLGTLLNCLNQVVDGVTGTGPVDALEARARALEEMRNPGVK